ncbi:TonB-dependent receptor [Bryobacter aggregatus]|uniref:TonB-dependent receptor n=1 Tax=Bryobacter aggregatus TaxID=360054 RepID=UPI0004E1F723|nr:TonB-dependent receptor [Bryobacter aggregatus]
MSRIVSLLLLCSVPAIYAQDSSALSGSIIDPSGAAVPAAKLTLFEPNLKVTRYALTNDSGLYNFDSLPPGDYSLHIAKEGFKDQRVNLIRIGTRDVRSLRLQMEIGTSASTSVTVTAQAEGLSTDVSTGIAMTQKFVKDLPVNGRSVTTLINLAPGVVSDASVDGGINVNGLRSNMNYYTVDGVSANTGIGAPGLGIGGPFAGLSAAAGSSGTSPSTAATGQSNLISLDAMQELRVQTSAFAPEYGRTPGAQISVTSRGGSNAFHGSLFGYFRNQRFNANDWFANRAGLSRGKMRQNDFGGTLGGKLIPNRTYFFLSYEQNTLSSPQTVFTSVPSAKARLSAPAILRPYLNAFPVANGALLDNGAAEFTAVYSNPSTMKAASVRVDHAINADMNLFVRYAITPSDNQSRGVGLTTANTLNTSDSRNETLTGAWIWQRSEESTNDLRINYTRAHLDSSSIMDNFGGATPLDPSRIFPTGVTTANGTYNLQINGLGGYSIGQGSAGRQQQINIVDAYSKTSGTHQYKFGVDYRRLMPTIIQKPYSASFTFNGLGSGDAGSFLSGYASNAIVSSNTPSTYPLYTNYSAYGQDTWKLTDRTTLTYGLRWDVNPAPGVRDGLKPLSISENSTLTQDQALYKTRWFNIAPRIGLSYQLDNTPGREMIFRGGAGMFYDIGYGNATAAFSGAPYSNVRLITQPSFPLNSASLAAPGLPATEPYGQVSGADNELLAPRILQWQATIERYYGRSQSVEVGYIGTQGRRMATQETRAVFSSTAITYNDATLVRVTTNGATSDYHGLNAQYRRRFSKGLQLQANYTYSHSIDSASSDVAAGFQQLSGNNRGNSNFDVRHNFNASGSYRIPGSQHGWLKTITNDWWSDFIFTMRTGLPFDIQAQSLTPSTSTTGTTRVGFFGQGRPNYNGLPVWISDATVPGGKRLNPLAFKVPTTLAQGNLGRNAIRGFAMNQLNLTFRRDLVVREGTRLQLRLEGYNVLNHPNFGNPNGQEAANLASSNFGVVNRMLNSGITGTGVYSNGGPRTMQVALRFEF